ncbi:MAG: 1,4-dihydroxy-6-naphthoate synthase [Desulfomicrobiaceae bacterium]|jgi:1,4-dihydroxy-6-naphthoate synthase|nr:1,4-dihydroxy-6-naphthoate synthase [Desulfomicrobiaceae bacterium]
MNVAISPCPNDTWIFGSWILGRVPGPAARFFWHDVQELNERAAQGCFDVIKVSAAAALGLAEYHILSCGGAFGLEHGPKLVTRTPPPKHLQRIAVPGLATTAYRLLRAALGPEFEAVPTIFHAIPEMVQTGAVDAGLVIHETALIYARLGLTLALDLGQWWREVSHGLPIPLGVIAMDRKHPPEARAAVEDAIRKSLTFARSHPEAVMPLVRSLAQELDAPTLANHIAAYANDLSLDMGEAGRAALTLLGRLGTSP